MHVTVEGSLLQSEEGSTHLNSSTEGHLSVSLAEVHVTHTQVCALQEHWEVHLSNQTNRPNLYTYARVHAQIWQMRQLLELSVIDMQKVCGAKVCCMQSVKKAYSF